MQKAQEGITRRSFINSFVNAGVGLAALPSASSVGLSTPLRIAPLSESSIRIKSIECVRVNIPQPKQRTKPRRPSWWLDTEVANPMSYFPKYKRLRSLWAPKWPEVWVKVTAEDGTWGLGLTAAAPPVRAVVEGHFASILAGENVFDIEKCWEMMFRISKPYGTVGLATLAISGVDLALWDCIGKLLDKPAFALLGGKVRDKIFAYATGNDVDWHKELGFRAFKLPCMYGPADGVDGLKKNERHVASMRELVGDECELMLDCYMALDVEYAVRLAERLRPYRLKWVEECFIPEDFRSFREIRRRVPWQTFTTGEHLYTPYPFFQLIEDGSVDILQPDICWCGGLTTCRKVAQAAETAGLQVMLHAGGLTSYGLHFTAATQNAPWAEFATLANSGPGVPLEEGKRLPGDSVPKNGFIEPNQGPGFGLGIEESWLQPLG